MKQLKPPKLIVQSQKVFRRGPFGDYEVENVKKSSSSPYPWHALLIVGIK